MKQYGVESRGMELEIVSGSGSDNGVLINAYFQANYHNR